MKQLKNLEVKYQEFDWISVRCFFENQEHPEVWSFEKVCDKIEFVDSYVEYPVQHAQRQQFVLNRLKIYEKKDLLESMRITKEEKLAREKEHQYIVDQIKSHQNSRLFFLF